MTWWWEDQPSTTIAADRRVFPPGHFHRRDDDPDNDTGAGENGPPIPLEVEQLLTLQGFRRDYPVQGPMSKRYEQVGNAVPPPLAAAVLRVLHGS